MSAESQKEESTSTSRRRGPSSAQWLGFILLVAALIALFFVLRYVVAHPAGTLDFVNLYTAGTILKSGAANRLYSLPLQRQIQSRIAPGGQFLPFDHLAFEAYLCEPLAHFSLAQAFLLWAGVNLCILALIFYLMPRAGYRLDADSRLVWLAACFPLAGGVIVLGQDSLFLAPIFLLAYLALKKRRDFLAGLVLGAGLFRFEILLPFVFIFLLRARWKVLVGFFVAFVADLAASVTLVGVRGLASYEQVLLEVGKTSGSRANGISAAAMPSLRGAMVTLFGGRLSSGALFLLVVAGTLLLLFWAAWQFRNVASPESPGFDLEFSMATIAALLASYHLFAHELTPLIVAGFLMLGYEGIARPGETILKRPGTLLLLLFSAVLIAGEAFGFREFSVEFIVLLGMMAWLSQEISGLRKGALPS